MGRILIGLLFLLLPSLATAQARQEVISDTSEGLTGYTVLTGAPKAGEGWVRLLGKCGYKNVKGEWVIQPQFDWAGPFNEGYAMVVVGARVHYERFFSKWVNHGGGAGKTRDMFELLSFDGGRLAIIDKTGRMVLEPPQIGGKLAIRLTLASGNTDSASYVSHELVPKFLDSKKDAWKVIYSLDEFAFVNGIAWLPSSAGCNYLRKSGDSLSFVFPQPLVNCSPFSEGLSPAQDRSMKWGYIGTDGNWVIPSTYDDAYSFSEGLASVKTGGLWGAIDKKGAMVISPRYHLGLSFSEGLAFVRENGIGHFIDRNGQTVRFDPKYDFDQYRPGYMPGFYEGVAIATRPRSDSDLLPTTVFLNKAGEEVFRFHENVHCSRFVGGIASCWYWFGEGEIAFDKSGRVISKKGDTAQLEQDLASSPGTVNLSKARKDTRDKPQYGAYMSALRTPDLLGRAAALDDFLRTYPSSVLKFGAQQEAMLAHLQSGNQARAGELAQSILAVSPTDVRALTVMTWLKRMAAERGDAQATAEAGKYAETGIKVLPGWQKPELMSESDFAKARDQAAVVFYGAAGFHALSAKDYAKARDYYHKSLAIPPSKLLDLYQLGVAELEMSPQDVNGFWHIGKAIQLAREQKQGQAEQLATGYGKAKYRSYHGSDEGWDSLVAGIKGDAPPQGFTVRHAAATPTQGAKVPEKAEQSQADAVLAMTGKANSQDEFEDELSEAGGKGDGANLDAALSEIEGASLLKQGDVEGAIKAYREAVKLNPGNAQTHTALGRALIQKRDLDGAIQEFGESVRLQPRAAEPYYFRGWCYHSKTQFDRALADYNQALALNPNYVDAMLGRADLSYATNDFQKAIAEYSAFLKVVPQSYSAYTRRASSYEHLRDYQKAIADFEKAIELDSKQPDAYNSIAWLLATAPVDGIRSGAKAVQYGEKAVALADKSRSFLYMDTLAAAYAEAGRFADAVAMQSKAVSLIPKDFDAKTASEMKNRLQQYKTNKPYRDST